MGSVPDCLMQPESNPPDGQSGHASSSSGMLMATTMISRGRPRRQ
jgi:hypothetical protein